MKMLKVNGIDVSYGSSQALFDVSIEVKPREIVTIIGSNGAGKTTTLNTISGILRPSKGTITLNEQPIHNLSPANIVRLGIAHCPEGRQLWPEMTVRENLDMGAITRKDKDHVQKDIEWLFKMFPIIEQRQNQLASYLSGGEQQALAIVRALISKPKILLFDEPSLGLSPILVKGILKTVKELREQQDLTVLLVEQNAYAALKIADRGYVLEKGKIILEGESKKIINDPYVRKAYLGM
ncbi:MAG: ABC transporter ATP-binding protein [Dehalobacterium sp.]